MTQIGKNVHPNKLHYAGIEFMRDHVVMKTIYESLKEVTQRFFNSIKEYV